MALQYLAFISTFFSTVEQQMSDLCWNLYGIVRKHVPSVCIPFVAKSEEGVAVVYSTLRLWSSDVGKMILTAADQQVVASAEWMGSQLEAYGAYERYTTVRQFWSAIAARISETWQNHGVLVGTVVVLYAIFIAALESLLQVWRTPGVQKWVNVAKNSSLVQNLSSYYNNDVQPIIGHWLAVIASMAQKAGAAMSGPVDSATRTASSSVDAVVRTGYYARFSEGVMTAVEYLQTTAVYKQVAIRVEPYVAPTWEKVCTSDAYAYLVDKFTPFKEE